MRSWPWILLAGCYAPSVPEGAPCGTEDQCPTGLTCIFDRCVAEQPPCVDITAGEGRLAIPRVSSDIVLDGDLADWPTCFITVDLDSAGLVRDLDASHLFAPGRFSVAASASEERIYVAAEVRGTLPLGDHAVPQIYLNHAISTYFDADGVSLTNRYDPDAMQIAVDHANRSAGYRSGTGVVTVPELTSATSVDGATFVIELSVTPATFGRTAFADTIGFDIGLVGGNGSVMTSELVWYQACKRPACGCASTDDAPYCDARQFGKATLAPR